MPTDLSQLQNKSLKECYILLKFAAKYLGIDLKAYQLKRLVLNTQMAAVNASVGSLSFAVEGLLFNVLSQPECKALFEEAGVDFARLERESPMFLPLAKKAKMKSLET